ncbi:MAG: glycosyltransferase family 2 protein, partial [Candidatus Nitrosotenuis sp.]
CKGVKLFVPIPYPALVFIKCLTDHHDYSDKHTTIITLKNIKQTMTNRLLANCPYCNESISLDQKTLRYQSKWFHASCVRSSLNKAPQKPSVQSVKAGKKSGHVLKTRILSESVYAEVKSVKKPAFAPQQVQISSALVELLKKEPPIQEELPIPKEIPAQKEPEPVKPTEPIIQEKTKKMRPDHVLVLLAISIFAVMAYLSYTLLSSISILAILIATGMALYHILSRKPPKSQYMYKTKTASVYSISILVLPFVFGTIVAFDGYFTLFSITQTVFLWSLTLSFWQTLLFVPLAVRSITREASIPDLLEYPRISVIIPAYNEEKVIRTTIESLLASDYPDKEIILVDDGSKDGTLDIAMQYRDRIKVVHKENGGKASALNQGMLYATGEIVTIVDADTIIGHSSLKHIAKGMAQENVVAVAGNIKVRNKVNWLTWCQALEYLSGIQIMRRGLDYFGAITIVPGALGAFRKKALEEAGSHDKATLVEDFDATLKVLRSGMVVSGSNSAISYTQAPQKMRDFYRQRTRWYRGNLQVLKRHHDILLNPRFGYLHRLSYPLMAIHMLIVPVASLMLWGFAAYQILIGNYSFVAFVVLMFIIMQFLLSAMAVRMDRDDKKMIIFSIFMVLGYKQIIDFLSVKAIVEEAFGKKAIWTSAQRIKQ